MSTDNTSKTPPSGSSLTEWTLLVRQPDQGDQEFFVQHGLTIGRNPSNTIVIADPHVERIHARIQRQPDDQIVVECVTDQARLKLDSGEVTARLVLSPGVCFLVGPATITCRHRQTRPSVVVTRDPWQSRCPRCHAATVDLPHSARKCPNCALPLTYHRAAAQKVGSRAFEGWLPLVVGPYRIRAFAAEGGMGLVLRGLHRKTDLPAAIKLLRLVDREADAWQDRFAREVETLKPLSHPHIVRLQDHGHDDHLLWLALDWIDGLPLSRLTSAARKEGQPFSIARIKDTLAQLADGLGYLHARGIVHRDLKPSNLLVGKDRLVKITDLGIAHAVHGTTAATMLTRTGSVMGTEGYMSPEQQDGRAVTIAADVFSLGVIWYELLTGFRPTGAAGALKATRPDCPAAWEQAINACLSPEPAARPTINTIKQVLAGADSVDGGSTIPEPQQTGRRLSQEVARAMSWLVALASNPILRRKAAQAHAWGKLQAAHLIAKVRRNLAGAAIAHDQPRGPTIRRPASPASAARGAGEPVMPYDPRSDADERHEREGSQATDVVPRRRRRWYWRSALFVLGAALLTAWVIHTDGSGHPQDAAERVRRYRTAANQGDAHAMFNLGVMYNNGRGVEKDDAQAVQWYRKAADLGNASAMGNLGVMYHNGRGVEKDDAQAVRWYRKAADLGNTYAMRNLGVMYDNGEGVEEDDGEAVRWYRKAADLGNTDAMVNLGLMYDNGHGVEKDDVQAVRLYRKAARLGHEVAQTQLQRRGLKW